MLLGAQRTQDSGRVVGTSSLTGIMEGLPVTREGSQV